MLSPRLHHFLDERHGHYTALTHERTITADQTAAATHIGSRHFAKTVMLKIDGKLAMMVMPASYRDRSHASVARARRQPGGTGAGRGNSSDAFPDCELGAMPPFGHLYGMPVYVDSRLTGHADIAFNAGSHTDAVRMPYAEFERLAQPEILWLTHVM